MHLQNAMSLLSVLSAPVPPSNGADGYASLYQSYIDAYAACRSERRECVSMLRAAVEASGASAFQGLTDATSAGVGRAETVYSWVPELEEVRKQLADVVTSAKAAVGTAAEKAQEKVTSTIPGDSALAGAKTVSDCLVEPVECAKRGVNYYKNKRRRERRRAAASDVVSGTTVAVVQRTAEELEAARTLAKARVAKNKVDEALAAHKLESLSDKTKTDALKRLEAARMEERINTAKARSQASYKKCDQSLKSLGSTGSAGEFALKQEAKRARDLEIKVKYLEQQLDKVFPHVPPAVRQEVADMPEPVYPSAWDVFGEPPEDYDEDQCEAYYNDLNRADQEAGEVDYKPDVKLPSTEEEITEYVAMLRREGRLNF